MPEVTPVPEGSWNLIALLFFILLLAVTLRRVPAPAPALRLTAPQFAPLSASDAAQVARDLGAAYADLLSRGDEP